MIRLHLVRHAHAEAGWGDAADPGLDDLGRSQAQAVAAAFAAAEPFPLYTSPLRRARETAAALEHRWKVAAIVESAVGEVPSPSDDLAERQQWLQEAMASTWTDLGPRYQSWRTMVVEMLAGLRTDAVIVTHFVLINAVIGHATGDDRVLCAPIANGEIVRVDLDGDRLVLVDTPGAGGADAVGSVR